MAGKHFDSYFTLTVACLCFIQSDHTSITEQYGQGHIHFYTAIYNIHLQDSWHETDFAYVSSDGILCSIPGHSVI